MPKKGRAFRQDMLKGEYENIDGSGSIGKRFLPGGKRSFPGGGGAKGVYLHKTEEDGAGTSIFDPVLCELAYGWFCPPYGQVLDPFAGGSVRGIVAAYMERDYLGVDLRPEQVAANTAQAKAMAEAGIIKRLPEWREGDSRDIQAVASGCKADFLFSCPPYFDLEEYSDDSRDLSAAKDFDDFMDGYGRIIEHCARFMLADNRFACFVVGDVRDKKTGLYRNFPGETIAAFGRAGLRLYNEAILVTACGSLPLRAGKQFAATRKLGKTHQNCLVFVKGDPIIAAKACGDCKFGNLESADEADLKGEGI